LVQLIVLVLDQYLQVLLIRLVLVKERSFSIDGGTIADVVNFGTQVLQSFSLAIHLKLSDLTLLVLFIKLEQLCPLLLELGDLGSLFFFRSFQFVVLLSEDGGLSFALL
jgi:hypothetical protein